MFVSLVVLLVIWGTIYGMVVHSVVSNLPQGGDPAWLASPEGQQALSSAILPSVIPLMLVFYLLLWPAFAAGTKRLHDRGRSGWVSALYCVPLALFMIAGAVAGLRWPGNSARGAGRLAHDRSRSGLGRHFAVAWSNPDS